MSNIESSYKQATGCTRHVAYANAAEGFNPLFGKLQFSEEAPGIKVARDIGGIPIPDIGLPGIDGIYSAKWYAELAGHNTLVQFVAMGLGNLEIVHHERTLQKIRDGEVNPFWRLLADVELRPQLWLRIGLDPHTLDQNAWRLIAGNEKKRGEYFGLLFPTLDKHIQCRYEQVVFKINNSDSQIYTLDLTNAVSVKMGSDNSIRYGGAMFRGIVDEHGERGTQHTIESGPQTDEFTPTLNDAGVITSVTFPLRWPIPPLGEDGDRVAVSLDEVGDARLQSAKGSIHIPGIPLRASSRPLEGISCVGEYTERVNDRLASILDGSRLSGEHLLVHFNH